MKQIFKSIPVAAGVVLLLAATGARLIAADDLPKAETILDHYVEVTGGKAAYQKVHSTIVVGTMDFAAMGIKGKITSYHAEPDKIYAEVDLAGIGKMQDGYDGKTAWSNNAMQGPHIKDGAEKAQALMAAHFQSELNWRGLYKTVETKGIESVDGKDCYKILLTPNEGPVVTHYYDKQSGLLVKTSMTLQGPMGEIQAESTPGDYRKEGDILMPHTIKQSAAGQEFGMTIESVKVNADIPKDRFDPPAEIKALMKK